MDDLTKVCLSCGLCCDGTVIGFVQLSKEELPLSRELIDTENGNGEGFFLQPCKKFCDGCTIYSRRPKNCVSFNCKLLESVGKKELDVETAIDIVNVVKQKKSVIEEKVSLLEFELQSQSFYFKMAELSNFFKKNESETSLTKSHLELLSDLKEFDSIVAKEMGVSLL